MKRAGLNAPACCRGEEDGRMKSEINGFPSMNFEASCNNHLKRTTPVHVCPWPAQISLAGLDVYKTETYGSDTTFYVASSEEDRPVASPKLTQE